MKEKEIWTRTFDAIPGTVYDVLFDLLVLAIIWNIWFINLQNNKLVDSNISTIEILKGLNTSLLPLKE